MVIILMLGVGITTVAPYATQWVENGHSGSGYAEVVGSGYAGVPIQTLNLLGQAPQDLGIKKICQGSYYGTLNLTVLG